MLRINPFIDYTLKYSTVQKFKIAEKINLKQTQNAKLSLNKVSKTQAGKAGKIVVYRVHLPND